MHINDAEEYANAQLILKNEFVSFILSDQKPSDVVFELPMDTHININDALAMKPMNEINIRAAIDDIESIICDIQIIRI